MNILLLGGTNFIGPYVVRRLLARECAVTVFHRGKTNTPLPNTVRHLHGDHSQLADHVEQFRQLHPIPIDNGQRTKTTEITGTTKSRLKRR